MNRLLHCILMRSFHLEVAHIAKLASKSQSCSVLLLFQSQIFLPLVSQNFFLVQQKLDTKFKE